MQKALQQLRKGELVILVDDAAENGPAYLLAPAEQISAEAVCRMVNLGGGIICVALTEERIGELGLEMMGVESARNSPDLAMSVEARQGVTTGISAADRAQTIRMIASTSDPKVDLVTPGHVFPWRAKEGGVLVRNTPAEAAVDLLRLAGRTPVAAICHCLDEKGELRNEAGAIALSKQSGFPLIRTADIIRHRLANESVIEKVAEAELPTQQAGTFHAICFSSRIDGAEHLALVLGDIDTQNSEGRQQPVLVRVQAEQRISDLLNSSPVPTHALAVGALQRIQHEGRGVFVYIRHLRKGMLRDHVHNLANKQRRRPIPEQLREFGVGAQILSFLGVERIRLLTNSKKPISGLDAFNLELVERIPCEPYPPQ